MRGDELDYADFDPANDAKVVHAKAGMQERDVILVTLKRVREHVRDEAAVAFERQPLLTTHHHNDVPERGAIQQAGDRVAASNEELANIHCHACDLARYASSELNTKALWLRMPALFGELFDMSKNGTKTKFQFVSGWESTKH